MLRARPRNFLCTSLPIRQSKPNQNYKKRKDSQVDNGDISVISCRHCNSIYDSIYYINVLLDSWFLITLFKQFKTQNLALDKNKIGMKNKH
jgi:hypothetical protein